VYDPAYAKTQIGSNLRTLLVQSTESPRLELAPRPKPNVCLVASELGMNLAGPFTIAARVEVVALLDRRQVDANLIIGRILISASGAGRAFGHDAALARLALRLAALVPLLHSLDSRVVVKGRTLTSVIQ
jgi:hypothetical protein